MRTIHHNEVSMEIFNDIYEFSASLNRPLNVVGKKLMTTGGLESMAERKRKDSFFATKTFTEAEILLTHGYDEGFRSIVGVNTTLKGDSTKYITRADVVGHTPHIANYIIGHPLNMIRTIRPQQPAREITIWYNRSEGANVEADEMIRASRHFVDAVKYIEDQNIRVTIYIMSDFCSDTQMCFCAVRLKEGTSKINLRKMAYPLVHPSFERRHNFHWLETSPVVTYEGFYSAYGSPLGRYHKTLDERRKYCIDNGLIGKRDVYLDSKALRDVKDAKAVVDMIVRQSDVNNPVRSAI